MDKLFKNALKGHQTLFIIDDCSAEGEINKKRDALSELAFSGRHRNHYLWPLTQKYKCEINKKRDALSELAFSGRHRNHYLWPLTQKYNLVSKDVREQIKWLCLFFTKDRHSFEGCFRENDVIPDKSERDRLKNVFKIGHIQNYFEMLPTHWLSFLTQLVVYLIIICYKFVDQLVV